jgi:CHAD domain-containing protein
MSEVQGTAVRDLCRQIAQETDPEKVHQLLVSLRTALNEEQ